MSTTLAPVRTAQPLPGAGPWWRSRRAVVAGASVLAALSGVFAAALIPRGPTTSIEVGTLMGGALLIGGAVGVALRSRWALLVAPALHLAAFELCRVTVLHVDGPSLDAPRFDVTMGVLVFFASHVMYAAVALVPMVLGAIGGAALTRSRTVPGAHGVLGRLGLGVRWMLTLFLVAGVAVLGMQLVRPGRVAPIVGADGEPVPGSVATMRRVKLGGVDQAVSIRGRSVDNPVLLHLSGGPGSSDVGWVRSFNQPLENDFTVAVWEQRGVGKSYPAIDPTSVFTLDRIVSDGIELSRWLAREFDERKIYLTGNSWGSTLGVLMVQRNPELYHAYAGTGQMVSQRETDRVLYRQLLAYSDRTGNNALRDQLRAFGEPPYRDVMAYAKVMEYYDVIEPYKHGAEFDEARGPSGFFPSEYSLLDTWNEVRGFADMGGLLYPQLQGLDFRRTVPHLDVPVYFMQGRHELSARSRFADEWIGQLQAPIKRVYKFDESGHNPDAEEPARFNDLMINTVLPETYR